MTEFKKGRQPDKSSQERQEAAQRFLEDRLERLEAIREMINAELDRRKDEFADHSKVENKDLSKMEQKKTMTKRPMALKSGEQQQRS
ncbi:protein regulator of cytokinesis 1 [Alloprevotella tannerae]|uniref:protein regulator of cytokinesis 1 n=1 Tax=Alloprevotella tannerae TaxID=76122 RepID=UPI0028EB3DBC|nr:protein regulator of cytokinesis 1 [Alloprevotella tannerae]